VTGRAGVGASLPHAESTIAGDSQEQYQWGSLSLQAAAGAEVRARGRVYVAAEYKLTRSVQAVSVAGGSARTPLTTHHVAAGVALHWGRMRGH
jgi:opacity protein-like surface antigen